MTYKISIEINNEKLTFITEHGQANDNLSDEQKELICAILREIAYQFSKEKP